MAFKSQISIPQLKYERPVLTGKDLLSINAHLILNKTTINNSTPLMLDGKEEVAKAF